MLLKFYIVLLHVYYIYVCIIYKCFISIVGKSFDNLVRLKFFDLFMLLVRNFLKFQRFFSRDISISFDSFVKSFHPNTADKNETYKTQGLKQLLRKLIILLQYRDLQLCLTLSSLFDKLCLLGCSTLPKKKLKISNFIKYTQQNSNILFHVFIAELRILQHV